MKKQLITSVEVNCTDYPIIVIVGKVFYTRRTKILKRLVRKVIHIVEVPVDYSGYIEKAKAEARRQMDAFVKEYYATA